MNHKYLELFGFTDGKELVGRPIGEMLSAECREEIERKARLRSNGQSVPRHYECVALRKDGTRFDAEFDIAEVLLPDGPATIAFISDISEHKRAEIALRESEDRYRDLVEHSEDLVCTHDLQGNLLSLIRPPRGFWGMTWTNSCALR